MGINPYYNEGVIVLKDDGKIPLVAGIPFPKKAGYIKTNDQSIVEWSIN